MGTPATPIDERLASLLETEQRLEARQREAEVAAISRLKTAREALLHAEEEALQALDEQVATEEQEDAAVHEAALRAIEAERNAALTRLTGVSDDEVDRLARRVLKQITEHGAKGGAAP
ncbi:MAG: hypothetical protein JNJ54_02270 [Myxococcaceae bacterium]|nr:hypothetical protein [Myxococcaceae bacterium]